MNSYLRIHASVLLICKQATVVVVVSPVVVVVGAACTAICTLKAHVNNAHMPEDDDLMTHIHTHYFRCR